jgi:predicted lipoprotein
VTSSSSTGSPAEELAPATPARRAARARTVATRPSRKVRAVQAAVVVVVLAAMGLATEWRDADAPATRAAAEQTFDPAKFGAETFPKVAPLIERNAVPITELVPALKADADAAGEKYGKREGSSPYSFPVTAEGTGADLNGSLLSLTVDGLPADTQVWIQVGPAITGTSLRDATGTIKFGDFLNQVQYADAGTALNNEVRTKVLAGVQPTTLTGKKISVVGAFTFLTPEVVTLTPVTFEVAP